MKVLGNDAVLSGLEQLQMQQGKPVFSTTSYALTRMSESVRSALKGGAKSGDKAFGESTGAFVNK